MGLFDSLMGNATEVEASKVQTEFAPILAVNERIEKAYQLIRDMFVFTDKRLILMDRQGITGNKVAYHSIPYGSITHFSIETAGHFDLDAELKIWITGKPEPLQKRFTKKLNIYQLQAVLAGYILK